MSVDHSDRLGAEQGEIARQLSVLEERRFRGSHWLSADEVAALVRSADDRIGLLTAELERQRRENQGLLSQVEMLRHGTLPRTRRRSGPHDRRVGDAGAGRGEPDDR